MPTPFHRAIVSVSDQTNLDFIVRGLLSLKVEVITDSETAALLRTQGVQVIDIAAFGPAGVAVTDRGLEIGGGPIELVAVNVVPPVSARTFVIAAVRLVLPWST